MALYISAAYRFTSSICFANPASVAARNLQCSYGGIAPQNLPGFFTGQLGDILAALSVSYHIVSTDQLVRAIY